MSRRTLMVIGAVLVVLALTPFLLWPVYKYFKPTPASAATFERTKAVVEKHPELKADWEEAMRDGVLTDAEANAILKKAGEKVEPE